MKKEQKSQQESLERAANLLDDGFFNWLLNPYPEGSFGIGVDNLTYLLVQGLLGNATFAEPTVAHVANNLPFYYPRELDEAARARHEGKSVFDVWSWRTYIRNFYPDWVRRGVYQALPSHQDILPMHIRVLNVWVGDHIGQHEEKADMLGRLLKANVQMESQLRGSFLAIDNRPVAASRMSRLAGRLGEIDTERLVLGLEHVMPARIGGLNNVLGPLFTLELGWQVNGKLRVTAFDEVSGIVREIDPSNYHGQISLSHLPKYIASAVRMHGKR